MCDWAEAMIWIIAIVALLIYSLYKLRHSKDPKDELIKAKQLLDEGLIEKADYDKIKGKLLKKITDD
jgi:hypothetical protein